MAQATLVEFSELHLVMKDVSYILKHYLPQCFLPTYLKA